MLISLPIASAGLALLWHHCISPMGIFWIVSEWFAYQLGVPDEVPKGEKWDALIGEKNLFFAFGLCPVCFGFWLSLIFGLVGLFLESWLLLPYTMGATTLILKTLQSLENE